MKQRTSGMLMGAILLGCSAGAAFAEDDTITINVTTQPFDEAMYENMIDEEHYEHQLGSQDLEAEQEEQDNDQQLAWANWAFGCDVEVCLHAFPRLTPGYPYLAPEEESNDVVIIPSVGTEWGWDDEGNDVGTPRNEVHAYLAEAEIDYPIHVVEGEPGGLVAITSQEAWDNMSWGEQFLIEQTLATVQGELDQIAEDAANYVLPEDQPPPEPEPEIFPSGSGPYVDGGWTPFL